MNAKILVFLCMLLLAVSVGCGNGDNGGNPASSKVVVTVEPAAFTQGVGLTSAFTATVTGATDTTVTWYVNNIRGGDSTTVGKITVAGRYRAPENVPAPPTVVVKATSVADPRSHGTALMTIVSGEGTGLPAEYSTGSHVLEGPIFHGWSWDCTSTNYNRYQGECVEVDASPVDWADGTGWSVTWTGQLFVPFSGDYSFSSYYWVDGIVYIAVNDTVVADFNTTGGGYSKTITLQGNTWVPVQMSFQPNGGSNNMHLGWVSPGGEWRPVARSYLKP
jgi:hypothetical protein